MTSADVGAAPRGSDARPRSQRVISGLALVGIALVALAARMIPVLRGGGLHGLGNYDDGVHFAAAVGLWHGLLPYRDFLLLHPPGIAVLLAPYAALAELIGEPHAMAAARLSWMLLGAVNALLIVGILRPVHRGAALIAGFAYAVFFPAVYSEHTTLLEAPGTTVLLAALALTRIVEDDPSIGVGRYLVAGLLLGLAPAVKIWGIVAVLIVVFSLAARRGRRPALTVVIGAATTTVAICLPFFVQAPVVMWQMVVRDQVNRRRPDLELVNRVDDILGLTMWTGEPRLHLGTVIGVVTVVVGLLICLASSRLRVLGVLLLVHVGVLLATPMWFLHNAALTAAPLILVLGASLGVLLGRLAATRPRLVPAAEVGALLALAVTAIPFADLRLNRSFASAEAGALVGGVPGCVVTDMPMTLIQLDALDRSLGPGCRYVVDLGGASYHLPAGAARDLPRARNPMWQTYALDYLRSGEVAVIGRFREGSGFSEQTADVVNGWPLLGRVDEVVITRPQPMDE